MPPPELVQEKTNLCKKRIMPDGKARNELNALERGEQLARRKDIYEALYPETKRGGDYGNQFTGGKGRLNDTVSFSQDTAAQTGQ